MFRNLWILYGNKIYSCTWKILRKIFFCHFFSSAFLYIFIIHIQFFLSLWKFINVIASRFSWVQNKLNSLRRRYEFIRIIHFLEDYTTECKWLLRKNCAQHSVTYIIWWLFPVFSDSHQKIHWSLFNFYEGREKKRML